MTDDDRPTPDAPRCFLTDREETEIGLRVLDQLQGLSITAARRILDRTMGFLLAQWTPVPAPTEEFKAWFRRIADRQ